MFIVWTIATTWVLFLFDSAWFERPIEHQGVRSLKVFFPTSPLEWSGVASRIIPLLFVIFQALFIRRSQRITGQKPLPWLFPDTFGQSGIFGWLLILLACILAITAWTLAIPGLLLPSTITAIGLSLSKLEQI